MKVSIAAVIVAGIIGIGASYVLHAQQHTVDVEFSSSRARIGDPDHNLTGMNRLVELCDACGVDR